jgi:VWFA-related protein
MRIRLTALTAALLLAALPALGQTPASPYRIEKEGRAFQSTRDRDGKSVLYVTVQFKITRDGKMAADVGRGEINVLEDGLPVTDLEIQLPTAHDTLTTVLAMDVSGSMAEAGKIDQAKQAARVFFDRLTDRVDCGLILFDHEILTNLRPVGDRSRFAFHREQLRNVVAAALPRGGTAYLDAAAEAIGMLKGARGRKAVLLMTDGMDLNSRRSLKQVIELAKAAEVPIYTVGVGEPGKREPVTTVLVLDQSGSMDQPASDLDNRSKMEALKRAASRFVDLMRPGARTTLLPFNDKIDTPGPFTANREQLKRRISKLRPDGGTLLFDATYDAIRTLDIERPEGKRAVVVLTDGKEEAPLYSRHRVEEVIDAAKQANIPLHMLGLGRAGEIDEPVMQQMARETGGSYYHARTEAKLFEIFENLSIKLHDDGIDEEGLRQLAEETGGKYYPARDISRLQEIYRELAHELQETYTVTFPSHRQTHDGTSRGIDISVVRDGVRVSEVARFNYNTHGLVVPALDHTLYLGLLAVLGGLLVLPACVRRFARPANAT